MTHLEAKKRQRSASLIKKPVIGRNAARMTAVSGRVSGVGHQDTDTVNCLGELFKMQVSSYGGVMKLIGYIRVSSKSQVFDGYGLDVQEADLKRWAKANGHRIVRIVRDEGVSGTLDAADRPGLSSALLAIENGEANGLLTARLDRLARALMVQEAILARVWKHDGAVFTATDGEVLQEDDDDAQRTFIRQILGAAAEFERKLVIKRMRDGKAAKRAAGRHSTGPYAYGTKGVGAGRERDAGPDPAEQAAVRRMLELRAAGHSYPQICTALAAEGIMPRRAAAWSPMTVRNIVLRHTTKDRA